MLDSLFDVDPTALVAARNLCHLACQWPSKAARANLAPMADDSHSNLGWVNVHQAFASHHLEPERQTQLGFSFSSRALIWLVRGGIEDQFDLTKGNEASCQTWVDQRLTEAGLKPTREVTMPYALAVGPDYADFAQSAGHSTTLGLWYAQAEPALDHVVGQFADIALGNPAVRCWPHHFDIGTLLVLEEGDPETARSIGIGMSPGDESYAEPYFYCSPFPAPEPQALPAATEPFRWHTDGFVSLICRASSLRPESELHDLLTNAVTNVKALV